MVQDQQPYLFSLEELERPEKVALRSATAAPQRSAVTNRSGGAKTKAAPLPSRKPQPAAPQPPEPRSPEPLPPEPLDPLQRLRGQLRRMEARSRYGEADEPAVFSAGGAVLNSLLPHGGLRGGTLVEWACDSRRGGAMLLAMIAAAEVLAHPASADRPLVVADGLGSAPGEARESFYPPAAFALGIPSERMVVFRKHARHTRSDLIWAIDQALRSGAVAAVFAEIGDWLDPADARRLQLAAESGGSIGLLVRPGRTAAVRSFADIRWLVSPLPGHGGRRLQVELVRCRGGVASGSRLVEIDSRPDFGVRDRVVAVRSGGASDAAAAVASGLVRELAHPAAASEYRTRQHPSPRRHAS